MEITRKFDEPYITFGNGVFLKYVGCALNTQTMKRLKLKQNFIHRNVKKQMIVLTNLPWRLFLHFWFPQDNFMVNTLET